jgi:hypothetical protein
MKAPGALLAVWLAIGCATTTNTVPRSLLAEVRARGARAVVEELWEDGGGWSEFTQGVASGAAEWLEVAVALAPGTDAGATSELLVALFLALEPAPERTFRLFYPSSRVQAQLGSEFSLANVCGGGHVYIDFEPLEALRLIEARVAAVQDVPSDLAVPRESCLRGLEQSHALPAH